MKNLNNIILIGMPGSGKSTVGVLLAKMLGYDFLDSDLLIQKREGKRLFEILRDSGVDRFCELENRVNCEIACENTVIATGGSAVYGKEAMEHFKSIGRLVYLKVPLSELEKRVDNFETRGVVMKSGATLKDVFFDRTPLYEKYADITVELSGSSLTRSAEEIIEKLRNA